MSNPKDHLTTDAQNESIEEESIGTPEVHVEFQQKYLPTLPRKFKSLRGTSISIESEKPQDLIELLGSVLEVTDYETNMASFWFLDTIALYALRYQKDLDDYYLTVLISWLAGEMTLIRGKKHPREEFFREMKEIFDTAADRMSEQNRLPYWDEIVRKIETEDVDVEGEEELSVEDQPSSVEEEIVEFSSEIDSVFALGIVIESTYDMYASELRYALVYAVFVEPIEVKTYYLPFILRKPRPVKFAEHKTTHFKVQLRMNLANEAAGQSKKGKKKASGKGKSKSGSSGAFVNPPPPSLNDEEMLISKRRYILPLIEANEASDIFDKHKDDAE